MLLFFFAPRLLGLLRHLRIGPPGPVASGIAVLAVATYGGYFNGGVGFLLLAVFALLGVQSLHGMNGLKNLLSVLLSLVSVTAFVLAGIIAWKVVLPMSVANACGAALASHLARRIRRPEYLRIGIGIVGLILTAVFFLR